MGLRKQYIGISRDHSGSMSHIAEAARKDYNDTVHRLREAQDKYETDTIVSVVKCGHGHSAIVQKEIVNSNLNRLDALPFYEAEAPGTPLWDSVGTLIELLSSVPDANNPEVSFLVMIITDGQENRSRVWTAFSLANRIRQLQATDRWTFVFRVPHGYKYDLVQRLGVPEGNVLEWDQTERGVEIATTLTSSAFDTYYQGRTRGLTASKSFYTNLDDLTRKDLKKNLDEINNDVKVFRVRSDQKISEFAEKKLGSYTPGTIYYQLMKPERRVQEYKKIIIFDRNSNKYYGGDAARKLLGLNVKGTISVIPGDHANYDIFIQSTSYSRKLIKDTRCVYWPN